MPRAKAIERSPGRAAVQTFRDGLAYCTFGDASGYLADRTQLWDNSHPDTSPCDWGNAKMIHWPVGWVNSGGVIGSDKDIMAKRLERATGFPPKIIPGGDETCQVIGVVTGGAGGELKAAAREGILRPG